MSKNSIRSRVEELETEGIDTANMAVFGYIDDDGQLVDEQGKPIGAAMFGIEESHK